MKIAILTSGILPVPAVQGGAVENLVDFYLEYNNRKKLHDITIYSVFHPQARQHFALNSEVNHYCHIDTTSIFSRLKRKLYSTQHRHINWQNVEKKTLYCIFIMTFLTLRPYTTRRFSIISRKY